MKIEYNSPENVVQRQLEAFNAKDVDAMAAAYAEDAQQFEHPATLLASGIDNLRERWTERFKDPRLHARLIDRMVSGNIVIDHEEVSSTFPEGGGMIDLIAIYQVELGKIAKAWFIFGPKILDGAGRE